MCALGNLARAAGACVHRHSLPPSATLATHAVVRPLALAWHQAKAAPDLSASYVARRCLALDPRVRLTMEGVLQHPVVQLFATTKERGVTTEELHQALHRIAMTEHPPYDASGEARDVRRVRLAAARADVEASAQQLGTHSTQLCAGGELEEDVASLCACCGCRHDGDCCVGRGSGGGQGVSEERPQREAGLGHAAAAASASGRLRAWLRDALPCGSRPGAHGAGADEWANGAEPRMRAEQSEALRAFPTSAARAAACQDPAGDGAMEGRRGAALLRTGTSGSTDASSGRTDGAAGCTGQGSHRQPPNSPTAEVADDAVVLEEEGVADRTAPEERQAPGCVGGALCAVEAAASKLKAAARAVFEVLLSPWP